MSNDVPAHVWAHRLREQVAPIYDRAAAGGAMLDTIADCVQDGRLPVAAAADVVEAVLDAAGIAVTYEARLGVVVATGSTPADDGCWLDLWHVHGQWRVALRRDGDSGLPLWETVIGPGDKFASTDATLLGEAVWTLLEFIPGYDLSQLGDAIGAHAWDLAVLR